MYPDLPHLAHITIVHADPRAAFWAPRAQRHAQHELVYIVRGGYEVHTLGGTLAGEPGWYFCFAPGQPHRPRFVARPDARGRCEALVLQWTETEPARPSYPPRARDRAGRVAAALAWLLDLHESVQEMGRETDRENHRETDAGAAGLLLAALLHELQRGSPSPPILLQSIHTLVTDALPRTLSLDEMAAAVGMGRFAFARAFRHQTGLAPVAYARRVRLERARQLILETTWKLARIASATGFSSAYHLSNVMAREMGRRPGSLRRS